MNLQNLFELQKQLDEHIEKKHPRKEGEDRLSKKILALQVELGELSNEWRGFKFWSNDQEPRTTGKTTCPACEGARRFIYPGVFEDGYTYSETCAECQGDGWVYTD